MRGRENVAYLRLYGNAASAQERDEDLHREPVSEVGKGAADAADERHAIRIRISQNNARRLDMGRTMSHRVHGAYRVQ